MEYSGIPADKIDALWELQKAYKEEIGEPVPEEPDREKLREAIETERIFFYGAWDGARLTGCCSVTVGFSTFSYSPSGVFEDFYILPAYRHRGIAHKLVQYAKEQSGVGTLTVGCAPCDRDMYMALGFGAELGTLLAWDA